MTKGQFPELPVLLSWPQQPQTGHLSVSKPPEMPRPRLFLGPRSTLSPAMCHVGLEGAWGGQYDWWFLGSFLPSPGALLLVPHRQPHPAGWTPESLAAAGTSQRGWGGLQRPRGLPSERWERKASTDRHTPGSWPGTEAKNSHNRVKL